MKTFNALILLLMIVSQTAFGSGACFPPGGGGSGDVLADGSVPFTGTVQMNQVGTVNLSSPNAIIYRIENDASGQLLVVEIKSKDSDNTDKVFLDLYSLGDVFAANTEFFRIEQGASVTEIRTFSAGTGTANDMTFRAGGQQNMKLITSTGGAEFLRWMATKEQFVSLTADNQSVTATNSMIRVNSDNVTSTLRTMNLQNGTRDGQRLVIISDTPVNAWELQVTANQCLQSLFTSTDNASINLIWNATTACWHEPR